MKRRKISKPKMTYNRFLVEKKFGKDIGNMILSFLFQCDSCGDLEIGPIYNCNACSEGKDMCRTCYDLTGLRCWLMPCFKCTICEMYHCLNHNAFFYDSDEYPHLP